MMAKMVILFRIFIYLKKKTEEEEEEEEGKEKEKKNAITPAWRPEPVEISSRDL